MKDENLYLLYIVEAADRVDQFTGGRKEQFLTDPKTQAAVLYNLHTLAESAAKLSAETKAQGLEISWPEISGFRNVIVHDYLGLRYEEIWDIIENSVPILRSWAERMLEDRGIPSRNPS